MEQKLRCPDAKGLRAGDDGLDICNLNDKICLLEGDNKCPYYEEFLREVENERDNAVE